MRKLAVERTFQLAPYENLKLFDEVEIPEEFTMKGELIDAVRTLQFLNLDLAYRNYVLMSKRLMPYTLEESVQALQESRLDTLDNIKTLMLNEKETQND